MQNRIILVSDDSDFFEFISPKLSLRKSDELYRYSFDEIPEKIDWMYKSLLIVNSENSKEKTIDLLNLIKPAVCIVFSYNDDDDFFKDCYNLGMLSHFTILTSQEEIVSKVNSALSVLNLIQKNDRYRELLVDNNLVTRYNEVFLDYNKVIDKELEKIKQNASQAVLAAISPNDKSKFLLSSNRIETLILNNIRNEDILMNYAPNKYFLLLNNTTTEFAQEIFKKIQNGLSEKIYAGFVQIGSKNRSQIINEALNKLHEAINRDYIQSDSASEDSINNNFKNFRKNINKNFEKVVAPIFYQFQQKYNEKLFGALIENELGNDFGIMNIKTNTMIGTFKISYPGFSKINVDIIYKNMHNNDKMFLSPKRIALEPDELEAGLISDLLEQFVTEFRNEVKDERIG